MLHTANGGHTAACVQAIEPQGFAAAASGFELRSQLPHTHANTHTAPPNLIHPHTHHTLPHSQPPPQPNSTKTMRTIAVLLALPALAAAFLSPMPGSAAPRAMAKTRRFINSDGPVTDVDVAGKLDPSR